MKWSQLLDLNYEVFFAWEVSISWDPKNGLTKNGLTDL